VARSTTRTIPRLASAAALTTPEGLRGVVGQVQTVTRSPLLTSGRSGAKHERLDLQLSDGAHLGLVLKRNRVADDWEARRTGDTVGREAAVLADPALAGIWEVFRCPFRAFALHDGELGLLMDDLTDYVPPDVDEPVPEAQEEALLGALAALHARYWNADVLTLPWLMSPAQAITCYNPRAPEEEARRGAPDPLFDWVRQGWELALPRLPAPLATLLADPRDALQRACAGLPRTLLHGNSRLRNFAFYPDGGVAAFDWAEAAAAPATLEVGWYLILNARRRARSQEEVLARYRHLLEAGLGAPLPDALWERLLAAGLLYGAAMLLWDRALDLDDGLPGAAAEWDWWVGQLTRRC
jgi:hypothetical protein